MNRREEIARRRTFAIISHPDAGKTTLTEKFLMYGGAIQLACSVTAKKNERQTSSDWMEIERKRGISVSSTVLQFEYGGCAINLLDTPGHRDFSEDTYRVLTAVDAVIMVVDAAKGIESQTRKLFEIARMRGIPIITFMNKLDRPSREPLELLDELESVLGIGTFAVNWPIHTGSEFKGVYDRLTKEVRLFERVVGGAYRSPMTVTSIDSPIIRSLLAEERYEAFSEELSILDEAGAGFDRERVLAGLLTPVFFGSASNNFGVQNLLDRYLEFKTEPRGRRSIARSTSASEVVSPEEEAFSGFIFKIQVNMDPRHRDRLAFVRICTGTFERDMVVTNVRTGKELRLSSSHRLFGAYRETVNYAYPGDMVGIVGHAELTIGDTLTEDRSLIFDEIPRFAPECFAYLQSDGAAQFKRFRQGLDQLLQEGVVQSLELVSSPQRAPLLAAVGPLQFEVVSYRMLAEYNVATRVEPAPWSIIRWLPTILSPGELADLKLPTGSVLAKDRFSLTVVLFTADWAERYFSTNNPKVTLLKTPPSLATKEHYR